ncbi:MAG TPA: DeoR/GlpR family DNA-binding transcription regulator [Levilinea sp.]|nr:DeoR/GlpR family DNA-binding transcription regulator [Levilinea sp.]
MGKNLYPEIRRQDMLKRINLQGQVAVTDLASEYGVSEVTIRADLQALADQNLLMRTHGGAVAMSRVPELSLNLRRQQQPLEKASIGAAAAAQIHNGEAVFLDTSSTALSIIPYLNNHRDITVITNSLAVSQTLVDMPGITVVMSGGTLQRDTLSLVGVEGLELLHKYNIQKAFLGAHGISDPEGLTDVSAAEAEVKQQIVRICRTVVAVLDSTKWGRAGLASFARLDELDMIITSGNPPQNLLNKAKSLEVKVIIV